MRIVVVLALAACRLQFDERIDARVADAFVCLDPIGHDEDGDTVDDTCDVCPQLTDDQLDADGDRVGDACDIQPTQQQRVLFDPFTARRDNDWSYFSQIAFLGDSIALPGVGTSVGLQLLTAPSSGVIEMAGRITGTPATGSRQIAMHVAPTDNSTDLYCELIDNLTIFTFKIVHYDGVTYNAVDSATLAGRLDASAFRMTFEYAPPELRCILTWQGTQHTLGGLDPGTVPAEKFSIAANNLAAELDYFVRLANP